MPFDVHLQNFLQRWIAGCTFSGCFLHQHHSVQANFSALSNARMEGSLCTPIHHSAGNPKCPNLERSSSPPFHTLGSQLLLRESIEHKSTWSLHRATPESHCPHAASSFSFTGLDSWLQRRSNPTFDLESSNHLPAPAHHDRKVACPVST